MQPNVWSMVELLRIINCFPQWDNTINVQFELRNTVYQVNCNIKNDSEYFIPLGLSALMDIELEIALERICLKSPRQAPLIPSSNIRIVRIQYNRVLGIQRKQPKYRQNNARVIGPSQATISRRDRRRRQNLRVRQQLQKDSQSEPRIREIADDELSIHPEENLIDLRW